MSQMTIPQAIQLGISHHSAGRVGEAEAIYRQVLQVQPDQPDALHLLGLLACAAGKLGDSIELIRRAAALVPGNAVYLGNLAEVVRRAGRIEEAMGLFARAIAMDPKQAGPHNNIGLALMGQRRPAEALESFRRALQLQPEFAEAVSNVGDALMALGRIAEAAQAYEASLKLNPNNSVALNNYGIVLMKMHRDSDALASFLAALKINPRDVDAMVNLGNLYTERRQPNEALAAFHAALKVDPRRAAAYSGVACLLKAAERPDEAIEAYEKALAIRPDPWDLANVGLCYRDRGQPDVAITQLRKALAMDPSAAAVHSGLIVTLYLQAGTTPEMVRAEQRLWNEHYVTPLSGEILPHRNEKDPDRKLRVGYVSADFREHPVGRFMLPLLAAHDRAKFEVVGYSGVPVPDEMTQEIRGHTAQWRPIAGMTEAAVARQVREDGIDILVDLAMHTRNNTLLAFARKPAPVQVSYLAYAGGSGVRTMDYRLTDAVIDPVGAEPEQGFEKPWRLPDSFWCYAPGCATPEANELPALKNGHISFASLSHMAKITPPALEAWAQLLKRVPGSTLCLHIPPGWAQDRCRGVFERAGVDLGRLIFEAHLKLPQYFEGYHRVDMALDPFPYSGGTTTCDALWMGVPVVGMSGAMSTSRSTLSLLTALGMQELVGRSVEEYLDIAVGLAGDLPRLAELRRELRGRMRGSALTDAARFVANVEGAYRGMWREWCGQR